MLKIQDKVVSYDNDEVNIGQVRGDDAGNIILVIAGLPLQYTTKQFNAIYLHDADKAEDDTPLEYEIVKVTDNLSAGEIAFQYPFVYDAKLTVEGSRWSGQQ